MFGTSSEGVMYKFALNEPDTWLTGYLAAFMGLPQTKARVGPVWLDSFIDNIINIY